MTRFGSDTIVAWLTDAADEIDTRAAELSALDAALGDGDHGANMSRGFAAVGAALAAEAGRLPPGPLLTLAGKTLMSTIGGASGALWGFALRRGGRALGEAEWIDADGLAAMLDAMVDAVVELGEASPGDKTMLDALAPASSALRAALDAGWPAAAAVAAAANAARAGADATADLEARVGRASFLGPRSIGHQDPSANSTAIILASLARAVAAADASNKLDDTDEEGARTWVGK